MPGFCKGVNEIFSDFIEFSPQEDKSKRRDQLHIRLFVPQQEYQRDDQQGIPVGGEPLKESLFPGRRALSLRARLLIAGGFPGRLLPAAAGLRRVSAAVVLLHRSVER